MQVTLTNPNKKADKRVKIKVSDTFCKQMAAIDEDDRPQTAEEFYEELREAIHEVNEAIAGRRKLQTFEEFIAELRSEG